MLCVNVHTRVIDVDGLEKCLHLLLGHSSGRAIGLQPDLELRQGHLCCFAVRGKRQEHYGRGRPRERAARRLLREQTRGREAARGGLLLCAAAVVVTAILYLPNHGFIGRCDDKYLPN